MTRSEGANTIEVYNVRKTLEFAKPKLVIGRYANSKSSLNNGKADGISDKDSQVNPMEEKGILLAYLAGIFDGEGYIHINKTSSEKSMKAWQRKTPNYALNVGITNTHLGILETYKKLFGGSIYDRTSKRIFEYRIDRKIAVVMLKALLPYLVIKKEQAKIAIAFQNSLKPCSSLTEEQLLYREKCYNKIKSLNGSYYHQQRLSERTSQIEVKR